MFRHEIYRNVCSENNSRVFRIKAARNKECIELTIIEDKDAWTASVHHNDVKVFAEQQDMGICDYFQKLWQYFYAADLNILFNIVKDQFIILQSVENIKIKCFATTLTKVEYTNCLHTLLDELFTKVDTLTDKFEILENERIMVENDNVIHKTALEEFMRAKEDSEKELYSSFLLVLNEKKKRIQYLNEILEARQDKPVFSNKGKINTKNISISDSDDEIDAPKSKTLETISDSDSYKTDDDSTNDEKMELTDEPKPSTSKIVSCVLRSNSPPLVIVPKRLKKETVTNNVSPKKDSDKSGTSQKSKEDETYNKAAEIEEDSPSLEFGTQDILNRL